MNSRSHERNSKSINQCLIKKSKNQVHEGSITRSKNYAGTWAQGLMRIATYNEEILTRQNNVPVPISCRISGKINERYFFLKWSTRRFHFYGKASFDLFGTMTLGKCNSNAFVDVCIIQLWIYRPASTTAAASWFLIPPIVRTEKIASQSNDCTSVLTLE